MYADCFFDFIQKIKSNKSFQSVLWEKADLKIFEIQKVHIQISKKKKKEEEGVCAYLVPESQAVGCWGG